MLVYLSSNGEGTGRSETFGRGAAGAEQGAGPGEGEVPAAQGVVEAPPLGHHRGEVRQVPLGVPRSYFRG